MNSTLLAVWRWLASWATWVFLKCRGYKIKSDLHRFFFDRIYADTAITVYASLADLHEFVRKQQWVADNITELWDAVCTPQKVQAVGQGTGPLEKGDHVHQIGDCDEFAIYTTAAIEKGLASGTMKDDNVANPRFFTVMWMERSGKTSGHNVCLLERPQPNGMPPKYSYMDYALPSEPPLDTPAQVAVEIASRYAGPEGNGGTVESGVFCWCISDTNLNPLALGIGEGWVRGVRQK